MSYYGNIREEELKNKVAAEWFAAYDCTAIVGDIDFSVVLTSKESGQLRLWDETEFLLWAEAKKGTKHDIYESFVQLILTIGRAHTIDRYLPPAFLGAFDAEKIAFIPYNAVMDVFSQNDFNWNVAPSNHATKEFIQLHDIVKHTIEVNAYLYHYATDAIELRTFIRRNFVLNKDSIATISINKNNFIHVYLKWLREVKPSLDIDWEAAKGEGLIDADFYLADLLAENNYTLKDKLYVLLRNNHYIYNVSRRATGAIHFELVDFNDRQVAHTLFWQRYARPPKEEYWEYIVRRRDLLVPQDIRERKGSFFTPNRWVELSQEYLARELGDNWQEEYYVWDCCAGTGNLLAGLTEKYRLFASTLDDADVRVMKDLIANNALNLIDSHVFQFDFLNDDFTKLPKSLQDIIHDPQRRKKLVVYINPPYAETATDKTTEEGRENKRGVSFTNTQRKYADKIGIATKELFAQFLIRLYMEIPGCIIANFSKLKIVQGPNFYKYRQLFRPTLLRAFICPAYTFDNVNGKFPIGFFIWDTSKIKNELDEIETDVYDDKAVLLGQRKFYAYKEGCFITDWYRLYHTRQENGSNMGAIGLYGSDFQHNKFIRITNIDEHPNRWTYITANNLIPTAIYLSVRHCIAATWLNDRDQFLYPKDTWREDLEFQADCLAYTLFHSQNRISVAGGTNHWIPFTETEVGAREMFESHFMVDYLRGKHRPTPAADLFANSSATMRQPQPIVFSPEATALMDAGRDLWRYYHRQPHANANAAFYDIRLHFQGTNANGKMNLDSKDEEYTRLIKHLRLCLKTLAKKIETKVYEHGFLM